MEAILVFMSLSNLKNFLHYFYTMYFICKQNMELLLILDLEEFYQCQYFLQSTCELFCTFFRKF